MNTIKKLSALTLLFLSIFPAILKAQEDNTPVKPLAELQQDFVDLRFGMFIHFNIPIRNCRPLCLTPLNSIVTSGQRRQNLPI